ncbi:hypothetical protein [Natronomonas marina]|uniref:hypothetical protein n=1 Tax=Natronomonas marina TaxID=2961939 RepID=UPI0020CA1798|nr:hypothetical protein [Natronomonas marina]
MVRLVNVVGSGRLNQYVDLDRIERAARGRYDCTRHPGRLSLRTTDDGPVVTVHRTGKYSVRNAGSDEELEATNEAVLAFLSGNVDEDIAAKNPLSIDNRVWVAERSGGVDLDALNERLGENAILPERSGAALVYRYPDRDVVVFVTRAGTVTVSGVVAEDPAERILEEVASAME